jgi:hypothetical protein
VVAPGGSQRLGRRRLAPLCGRERDAVARVRHANAGTGAIRNTSRESRKLRELRQICSITRKAWLVQ